MRTGLLSDCLRPGDRIFLGQAVAEPVGLVQELFELAPRLGPLQVFAGFSLNPAWAGPVPEALAISTYCGLGTLRKQVASGRARVVPASLSQLSAFIASRKLAVDVVMLQVTPADAQGFHSLGCTLDYVWDAVKTARVVVVEVNTRLPVTRCSARLHTSEVVVAHHSDSALLQAPPEPPNEVQRQVARQVSTLVPDGATVQLGIGGLAMALGQALRDRRGLKIRSGMVGDWFLDLLASGAIDTHTPNACLASLAVGSQRLYDSLSVDGVLGFAPPGQLVQPVAGSPYMAINSAIEVDLCGQINTELLGDRYVGTIGGQVDYFRAARRSAGGLAILALPATTAQAGSAGKASKSRVVRHCAHVSTAPSDVDMVVTEHGVADLRATSLAERQLLLAAIADPQERAALQGPAS